MSDLWGFAAGREARRESDRKDALANLALRRGDIEIQQGQVALEQSQLTLDSQKQMIELMRQKSAQRDSDASGTGQTMQVPGATKTETDDLPNSLDELAKMALDSGLPQQAAEYASKASTIRQNASEIRKRATDERIADLTLASNLLSTVGDETSWRQANALFEMTTGKPSPFANLPYSPETVAQIHDSVISEKDRALTDAARARMDASAAQAREAEVRQDLIRAQTTLTRARTAAVEKTGGKPPKAEDLRAITDLMTAEIGMSLPEDARVLARPVAERMTELMREENLTRSQAARRAFDEAVANGDFGGIRLRPKSKGSSPTKPMDMPATAQELRPNMYYIGKGKYEGRTLLYTGTGFKVVNPRASAANAPDLDEDDEDGEEGFDNEHTEKVDEGY